MADLSQIPDDELERLVGSQKPQSNHLAAIPDDVLEKAMSRQIIPPKDNTPGLGKSLRVKAEEGISMGFRPAIAGAGQAIGQAAADVSMKGIPTSFDELIMRGRRAKDAFFEGRDEARKEQEEIQAARPGLSTAAVIGGNIATLPLLPLKGAMGAAKVGALMGAGDAASNADSAKDALERTAMGATTGLATYGLFKGGEKALQTQMGQKAVQATSNLGKKAAGKIGQAAVKTASAITGVSEKEIQTYAQKLSEVNKLIKSSDGNVADAADKIREQVQNGIRSTKDKLGRTVGDIVAAAPEDRVIDIKPIIEMLQKQKAQLNKTYATDAIQEIDDIVAKILTENPNGMANLRTLHQAKEFLQEQAKSSYLKGGQIFPRGKDAAKAAKQGAAQAKVIFDKTAPQEAVAANKQLFQIHRLEDNLNKNLIAPGKSESALLAAGRGQNQRSVKQLEGLGKLTGQDIVGEAEKLAAAKTFGNVPLLPMDTTGKAVGRMALGAGTGYALDGQQGAMMGAALSSPSALKLLINGGRIPAAAVKALGGGVGKLTDASLSTVYKNLQTPQGQAVLINFLKKEAENLGRVANDENENNNGAIARRLKSMGQ